MTTHHDHHNFTAQSELDPSDVSIFDENNARSIINLLPPALVQAVKNTDSKYFKLGEAKLARLVEPTDLDNQLRTSFWMRYEECQDKYLKAINMLNVYKELCTKEYFYTVFIKDPLKIAWMLRMRKSYHFAMEELLDIGLSQFREIMLIPNKVGGKVDTRLVAEKVKIFAIVENRVKGAVAQKIEQKNLNVNVNTKQQDKSVQDVEKELKALNKEIKQIEQNAIKNPYVVDQVVEKEVVVVESREMGVGETS